MSPEESPTERVTLSLVFSELGKLRAEFNGGLESLRCKLDEQSSSFVTRAEYQERGRRYDSDFVQVQQDVLAAKKGADDAITSINNRINGLMTATIVELFSILGTVVYVVLTRVVK